MDAIITSPLQTDLYQINMIQAWSGSWRHWPDVARIPLHGLWPARLQARRF